MARVVERDRRDKGDFVLRAAARLTAGSLAAEVCVVHQHRARQAVLRLALDHRRHEFVVDQPSGRVAHAVVALEFQTRKPNLGLADEVDRQKPRGRRQLGAAEQRARSQRGLAMACTALKPWSAAADDDAVGAPIAAWTAESGRATSAAHGNCASGVGAKALEKLGQ